MTPEPTPTEGQGTAFERVQSPPPGVSPAAYFYTNLRAEAAAGAPPAAVTPPADGGGDQGAPPAGGTPPADGGGFNWELFPDVPEDQRQLLEPHLKKVQGHVTQLEQKSAPFKQLADAGLDAQTVQGILNLDQAFAKDPTGTWLQMGRDMQQQGTLPDSLDMDAAQAILEGKDGTDDPPAPAGGEEKPPWAEQLDQRLSKQEQAEQARQQQEAQAKQDAQLEQAVQSMTSQLKEAGLSDAEIEKAGIIPALIAAQGDPDKALQSIIDFWSAARGGLTDKPKPGDGASELEMPKGAPEVPDSGLRGGGRDKAFAEARKGAAQFLRRKREES